MSTALVSAFYEINDVIQQQNKARPSMLDLRPKLMDRRPGNSLSISRRHSTPSSMSALTTPTLTKQALSPTSSSFFPMPPSPKEQYLGNMSPLSIRDRTQSASFQEELEAQQRKRSSTNSSRYKTELCRPFEENGTCKYGDKCQFAHGFHELRGLNRHPKYKTEFCRTYHTIGFCPYGPRCHFIHNDEEKRLAQGSVGRPISLSSMDSSPSSPVIDINPSPFSYNMTPPTSPGNSGDVFLFDEPSQIPQSPLSLGNQNLNLNSIHTIPEHSFPSKNSGDYVLPRNDSGIEMVTESLREMNFHPINKQEEQQILTPSDSGSSNPPSPTDSLEGNRRRLPVFGFVN